MESITLRPANGNVVTLSPALDSRILRLNPLYGVVVGSKQIAREFNKELKAWGVESVFAYTEAQAARYGF